MRGTPSAIRLRSHALLNDRARPSDAQRPCGRVRPPLVATAILSGIAVPGCQGSRDQPFVVAGLGLVPAVRVCGVEECDARVQGCVDRLESTLHHRGRHAWKAACSPCRRACRSWCRATSRAVYRGVSGTELCYRNTRIRPSNLLHAAPRDSCGALLERDVNAACGSAGVRSSAVGVHLMTDEAEAVLGILAKRNNQLPLTEADWSRLLTSEGYVRLKAREASMKRSFEDEAFKSFVLSPELGPQTATLETDARPMVKGRHGSAREKRSDATFPNVLVSGPRSTPSSNLRLTVSSSTSQATLRSFCISIPRSMRTSFATRSLMSCTTSASVAVVHPRTIADEIARLPQETQTALTWIGAFGEGFAMLAAAGSPDSSSSWREPCRGAEQRGIEVSRMRAPIDSKLEGFFQSVLQKQLTGDQVREAGFQFFGVQGPWYTVGWQMAVTIERAFWTPSTRRSLLRPSKAVRRLTTRRRFESLRVRRTWASGQPRWSASSPAADPR